MHRPNIFEEEIGDDGDDGYQNRGVSCHANKVLDNRPNNLL